MTLEYVKRIRDYIGQRHFIHIPSHVRNTVLLSSMGRSGSTWIASLINYGNVYREVFEPFLPIRVPEANVFEYCQYIQPDNDDPAYFNAAKNILEGRLKRQPWIDSGNRAIISSKRLIKDIRTNLMLEWFRNKFPEMKIIFLVRNPFSVVQSFMDLGWGIEPEGTRREIDILLNQEELIRDYPIILENAGKVNLNSTFELLIFQWCILHYVPLSQCKKDNFIQITYYENFLLDPSGEIRKLYEFIGQPMDERITDSFKKPSRTSYDKKEFSVNSARYSEDMLQRGYQILEMFDLHDLYSTTLQPRKIL